MSLHKSKLKEYLARTAAFRLLRKIPIGYRLFAGVFSVLMISSVVVSIVSTSVGVKAINRSVTGGTHIILDNAVNALELKLEGFEQFVVRIQNNTEIRSLLAQCQTLHKDGMYMTPEYRQAKQALGELLYPTLLSSRAINLEIVSPFDEFNSLDSHGAIHGGSLFDAASFLSSELYTNTIEARGGVLWHDTSKLTGIFRYGNSEYTSLSYNLTLTAAITYYGYEHPLGIIVMNVPLNAFEKLVDFQNVYDSRETVFWASDNGVIAILNNVARYKSMPSTQQLQECLSSEKEIYEIDYPGNAVLLMKKPSNRLPAFVVYMVDKSAILGDIRLLIVITVIVLLVCGAISTGFYFLVTQSIAIPLHRLSKAMGSIGEDGLLINYEDNGKDEVAKLSHHFNAMILRIQGLLERLVNEERALKDEQICRKNAELDALQMQIDPHFLYNTLDLIRWNAIFKENGEGQISQMLAAFSSLLRFNTRDMNKLISLRKELNHVEAYIKVVNFKENLTVRLTITIEPDTLYDIEIPKLMLQPLVENAVKHGVHQLGADISIVISVRRAEDDAIITVWDNGCGIPPEKLHDLNKKLQDGTLGDECIGLRNVNERLKLHFGDSYGLHLNSEVDQYTESTICLPIIGETVAVQGDTEGKPC